MSAGLRKSSDSEQKLLLALSVWMALPQLDT